MTQELDPPPLDVAAPRSTGTDGFAIASLVLGIVWLWWIGSILAIVFGVLALRRIAGGRSSGKGLAVAGLVLGIVGVAVLAVGAVLAVAVGNSDGSGSSGSAIHTVLDSYNDRSGDDDDAIPIRSTFAETFNSQSFDQQSQVCAFYIIKPDEMYQRFAAEGIFDADEVWNFLLDQCYHQDQVSDDDPQGD